MTLNHLQTTTSKASQSLPIPFGARTMDLFNDGDSKTEDHTIYLPIYYVIYKDFRQPTEVDLRNIETLSRSQMLSRSTVKEVSVDTPHR